MTFSQTSDSCDKAGQWSYNSSFVLSMCACLWVRKNHCSTTGCPRGSELQGECSAGWAKARSRARLPAPLKLPGVMPAPYLLVLGGMGITPRIHETLKWREAWSPWMMSLDDIPDPFLVPDVLGWCLWPFAGQRSVDLLWTSHAIASGPALLIDGFASLPMLAILTCPSSTQRAGLPQTMSRRSSWMSWVWEPVVRRPRGCVCCHISIPPASAGFPEWRAHRGSAHTAAFLSTRM